MAESSVSVKVNERQLRQMQNLLREVPREVPKVMSRAINKTATSTRADIARRIGIKAKITQKVIKKAIIVHKATRQRWQATLDITRKRIPLIAFKAKQTKKGVTYQIERAAGRKRIPSAFVQTMPMSGHLGVFRRRAAKRLPIIQLFGPSIGGLFEGAAGIAKEVTKSAHQKLEQNIDAQVKYILEKRKAG